MSRRRTSSAPAVSLFPFLAVLVCAMGALILLLLVTTRRIRQRTLARDIVVQPVEHDVAPAPSMSSGVSTNTLTSLPAPDPSDEPILPLFASDPPVPPPKPHDPTPELLARLAELEARHARIAAAVADSQRQLSQLQATSTVDAAALANLAGQAAALDAEKERLSNLYVRLREQEQDASDRADELRRQIQQARAQAATADSKFAIVPYDGHSGTTRHPIIIECTADRLTFASEGISLSATDLDGFTPRYNPLLFITQALVRYWDRRDKMSAREEIGEPYVLLVVRPGGTTTYYVARALLAGMKYPFGYELVTDDQEFSWPERDLEAAAICRTLIDRMLAERDEMMEVALQHGAQLEDFSDSRGQFRLEEIDRRLKPTRELTINGQRFSRDANAAYGGLGNDSHRNSSGDRSVGSPSEWEPPRQPGTDTFGSVNHGERRELSEPGNGRATQRGSVVTRQNTAVTQEDRMPEWLREGTTRIAPPARHTQTLEHEATESHHQRNPDGSLSQSPININEPRKIGRGNTFNEGAARSGSPSADAQPQSPEVLTLTPDGEHGKPAIDPTRPQWGIRSANGTIGFERELRIGITGTQVNIGEESAFQISDDLPAADLQRILAASIDREVRSWGAPPRSFYWVPSVRFQITPEGRQYHQRLRKVINAWDLRSTVEYVRE